MFQLDPSVFCVSLGNPLYPAILPSYDLQNHSFPSPEDVQIIENILQRSRKIKDHDFKYLPSEAVLRRVDHFMFYGATMVHRTFVNEILRDFKLTPFPITRASPRPKDFVHQGEEYPAIKEYDVDEITNSEDGVTAAVPKTVKGAAGFTEEDQKDGLDNEDFDIMVSLLIQ